MVYERGLANIGLADDGNLDAVVFLVLVVILGEVLDALVQKIARAVAVDGRNGDGITHAELIKLIYRRVDTAGRVHFVDCEHCGLSRAQQHIRNILVGGGDTRAHIGDEDDDIRCAYGDIRLLAHEHEYLVIGRGLDAAGVDDIKLVAAPLALSIQPVTGDAGRVLNDGQALAHELIKQH